MAKRLAARCCVAMALSSAALSLAAPASARELTIPIVVDERFLTQQLVHAAYTDQGDTARVFDDGSGCNFLVLYDPVVATDAGAGRLRVRTAGEARVGVAAGERCLLPVSWSGTIELVEEPVVDPGAPIVRFVVVDSTILDAEGKEPLASGTIWSWVKSYVHPRLETRIDLEGPIAELRSVLPAFGLAAAGSPLDQALASLSLDRVEVREDGVAVQVRADVPEPPPAASPLPAASPGSEPPLTEEELRRWQVALQQWDAFLTFVVKVTGSDTKVAEVRSALLGILLDERYAMLDALANPDAGVRDPVRPLFLRTWSRLAPVLRRVSDALPADEAVRYLSFVSAGDALAALEELGPEYGIEISADGLRRFARLVSPATLEDPLTYGVEIDPQLRELFGFGAPIPPPEENPEVEEPTSWLPWTGTAWAADEPDKALLKRLNSWAPTRSDVAEYAPLARRLLEHVTEGLLARHEIARAHQAVFRALVPATAWKESCWRQFVRRSGKLVPLTSKVGSVGIMQVNVSVWRGFYDLNGLRRDIGYNARAGGEILVRYFTDYAVERREDKKGGSVDALARAAYAAYNGGPGELSRYRLSGRSKRERAVDLDFYEKYKRTKAGESLAVVECFTE